MSGLENEIKILTGHGSPTMTKEEAKEIVRESLRWNLGQKSMSLAFGGPRTVEDDIYDERRKLILAAYKVLNYPEPRILVKNSSIGEGN